MGYFDNRYELADQARLKTEYRARNYAEEISECIKNTKEIQSKNAVVGILEEQTIPPISESSELKAKIAIEQYDSVTSALLRSAKKNVNITILNYASYKNPGGMFLKGSSAQEECLCHSSYLYNVLREFDGSYYEWNRKNLNRALYLNRALVSPNVRFFCKGPSNPTFKANVITCAAPNYTAYHKYNLGGDSYNEEVLRGRIQFVMDVYRNTCHSCDPNVENIFIIGAYGCGVFGQDPTVVAEAFIDNIASIGSENDIFVFAIPRGPNYDAMYKVVSKYWSLETK